MSQAFLMRRTSGTRSDLKDSYHTPKSPEPEAESLPYAAAFIFSDASSTSSIVPFM